jgi:nitroimidazol reductase NimA-like FMN-containing flavoprotein (pyridoxamine 5'-phosphate oxidase superfamily)
LRRREKEITDRKSIVEILASGKVCRLALTDGRMPYMVPVNYGYKDNALYVHSSKSGKKIDMIQKNSTVCFEIEQGVEIVSADAPCSWNTRYTCLIGYGRAELLPDRRGKTEGLEAIMKQQSGREGWRYDEKLLEEVAVLKITIDSVSGKRSD